VILVQRDICSALSFATVDLYLQQMKIKASEVCKIARNMCKTCTRTVWKFRGLVAVYCCYAEEA